MFMKFEYGELCVVIEQNPLLTYQIKPVIPVTDTLRGFIPKLYSEHFTVKRHGKMFRLANATTIPFYPALKQI